MTPKIIKAYPPNFNELCRVFPIKGRPGIVYSWGERIYNPSGHDLSPAVIAHETVHCERQLTTVGGVEGWWRSYIDMPIARLAEEVLAHQAEYREYAKHHSSKKTEWYLEKMMDRLSGPIYKFNIDYHEARKLILGG